MKLPDILSAYAKADRTTALASAGFLIASIALADVRFQPEISLGVFYIIPMLIAALYVSRIELLGLAVICTLLRELLGPFAWDWTVAIRAALGMLAYFGSGLFVAELARRRRTTIRHLQQLEEQGKLRQEAEEQLRVLIETSPAAILTVDDEGKIVLANQAAQQTLASEEPLRGQRVAAYLPILAEVPPASGGPPFRTTMECRGRRKNGEVFLAQVWFSTYSTYSGSRLAAIVLDTSETVRDREEQGLARLMNSSRILVHAVSHEIRNLCAAIAVVRSNLRRIPEVEQSEDFLALDMLVDGLGKLVSTELRPPSENHLATADLRDVLDELRIIVEPTLREEGTDTEWEIPNELPPVYGDPHGLLQVFMNLVNNSRRALQDVPLKHLAVCVSVEGDRAVVRFTDSGSGVRSPEKLFQPFQPSADGVGLGLYLSRALVRAYAGNLRYELRPSGACFAADLPLSQRTGAATP